MMYLFQVTLAWSAFALLYATLLRHTTFHFLNRIYLLMTLLLGLVLPFWGKQLSAAGTIPTIGMPEIVTNAMAQADRQVWRETADWNGMQVLMFIWGIGLLIGLIRIMAGLYRIAGMARRAIPMTHPDGARLLYTDETELPCTFFNRIFVPIQFDTMPDADDMLAHERGHAQQAHTVDVLVAELICAVFWWHPLTYWYRHALRLVHEYLADAVAIRHSSRQQYGRLLIRQAQSGPVLAIVHHFYQSPLKQRLVMLTTHHSSPRSGWKFALLLPVLAMILCFCRATDELKEPDALASFPGGQEMMMKYLGSNILYPESSRIANSQGTVIISFIVEKDGKIGTMECINADKMKDNALIDEAKRVIAKMPDWEPGMADGKPAKTKYVLPIKFKL